MATHCEQCSTHSRICACTAVFLPGDRLIWIVVGKCRIKRTSKEGFRGLLVIFTGLVTVVTGLVRAFHRHTQIIGLARSKRGQLDSDLLKVKAGDLFIELL